MATVINTEDYRYAMNVIHATLTFSSGSQSVTTPRKYMGFVVQCFIDHGDTTPTNLWDLEILDAYGMDVLNGQGANLAVATDKKVITQIDLDNGMACSGALTFSGTNGGSSNGEADIYLYIARYR